MSKANKHGRFALYDEAISALRARLAQPEQRPEPVARTFTMYRRNVPTDTHDENQRNAPDEPQFEGVVFSDGRVAIRWLTAKRSVSVWDSLDDMLAIHGHPEYGSELVWHASPPPRQEEQTQQMADAWRNGYETARWNVGFEVRAAREQLATVLSYRPQRQELSEEEIYEEARIAWPNLNPFWWQRRDASTKVSAVAEAVMTFARAIERKVRG